MKSLSTGKPLSDAKYKKPSVIFETDDYAVLFKPRGLATAPLAKNRTENLLEWFLDYCPAAATVCGIQKIEAGLVHRLDTPTTGLVLVAKNQRSYNSLAAAQSCGKIEKTYTAYVHCHKDIPDRLSVLPAAITSRFRGFGPGKKKVQVLTPNMRRYKDASRDYTTQVIQSKYHNKHMTVTCRLTRGYRHQVRAHLAWLGIPIAGDLLYNTEYAASLLPGQRIEFQKTHQYPLALYAVAIRFLDMDGNIIEKRLDRFV